MGIEHLYSVYDKNYDGEKHLVLRCRSMEDAERSFEELKILDKYRGKRIEWQYTYFDDEVAVGEIV